MEGTVNDAKILRSCFDEAPIGAGILSSEGRWMRVNEALCAMLGYTTGELLFAESLSLTHPSDVDRDLNGRAALLAGNLQKFSQEIRYFHRKGGIVWLEMHLSLIRDSGGRPEFFLVHLVDISERKRAEFERDAFFRLSTDMIAVLRRTGHLSRVNDAWTEVLGWRKDDLLEQNFLSHVHPEDIPATIAQMDKAFNAVDHGRCVNRCRAKDGSYKWIDWACNRSENGLVYAVGRDVTLQGAYDTRRDAVPSD